MNLQARKYALPILAAALFGAEAGAQTFVRKPFLQLGSPTSASVCWRVDKPVKVDLKYGKVAGAPDTTVSQATASTDGCLAATGLAPSTKYFYELSVGGVAIAGQADQYFVTHPPAGAAGKYSFWIIGDAGTGGSGQVAVKNGYIKANAGTHSDAFVLLGDNAYEDGTDKELTDNHFKVYPTIMANTFTWATIGNHENQSNGVGHLAAWYMPTEGQSGGVPSKSELYFSYDYGNVHWICLDSEKSGNKTTDPMYKWLEQDLQATKQDWIIAFWHTSPYSWGSHDSDEEGVEMRERFVVLLEKHGVDLVFTGHSHNYERSYLLNGAYGNSSDNKSKSATVILDKQAGAPDAPYKKSSGKAGNLGAVYTVAGSSGDLGDVKGLHPVMYVQHRVLGSVLLSVEENVATARFIDDKGAVRDQFRIVQPKETTSARKNLAGSAGGDKPRLIVAGRRVSLQGGADLDFQLYAPDGRELIRRKVGGSLDLDPEAYPAGEYYYRYGSDFGSLTLP